MTDKEQVEFAQQVLTQIIYVRRDQDHPATAEEIDRATTAMVAAVKEDDAFWRAAGNDATAPTEKEARAFGFGGAHEFGEDWEDAMKKRFPATDEIAGKFWAGEFAEEAS